jgi:hypothetical protein
LCSEPGFGIYLFEFFVWGSKCRAFQGKDIGV